MQTPSPSPAAPGPGRRPKIAVAIDAAWSDAVLDADARARVSERADLVDLDLTAATDPAVLGLITGWGAPRLDAAVLDRVPGLKVVCHAAGTVRGISSEALWARGVRVTSAAGVNALPVVDFTLAQIVLALKNAWRLSGRLRTERMVREAVPGAYGATIGLVGLGRIGRMVGARLQGMGMTVLAYDPYADEAEADRLGLQLLELGDLAERSEVFSVHAPLTGTTAGMITAEVLERLPIGATLINTARGALIDTDDLIRVLQQRPDLCALLDVTDPEPLPAGHPLLTLPNVLLTPHIAGSLGREVALLGNHAADQIVGYLDRGVLTDEVVEADLHTVA